ncbi:hypothetical protein AcW1_002878 [Taiwanofungus camphoratus]|nr:hypothetical protein AcW1_002878 [Antrodia cinnamomea]
MFSSLLLMFMLIRSLKFLIKTAIMLCVSGALPSSNITKRLISFFNLSTRGDKLVFKAAQRLWPLHSFHVHMFMFSIALPLEAKHLQRVHLHLRTSILVAGGVGRLTSMVYSLLGL